MILLTQGAVTFADEVAAVAPTCPYTGVTVPDMSQLQGINISETRPVNPTLPSTILSTE